ncbi:Capsular polysaccharide synthesis enzyme CpsD, exopolysaccharide synthesis [Grimontia indica]|uniref:non-specific protein-tyrosine kinase n=1 Tax=Grimontia indica TaxID=1056512 RepID=R1IUT3_9GAMM|nr:polysaccharide biosynthesis tyrosine autokinase [Grimontia indica]EOD79075.1 Capsular polysaccharide synthesis enzyme CpsD, exopolysaccharide synthesis [Grimontia indica]
MSAHANETSAHQEQLIDIGYYIHLIKKRWLSIFFFTLLCTAIAALVALSITPTYRATATLLIESQQANAISIEEVVGIDSRANEYYLTQFEILKSNQVAQRVIDKLQLSQIEEFNPSIAANSEPGFKEQVKGWLRSHPVIDSFFSSKTEAAIDPELEKENKNFKILKAFKSRLTISPIRKTQLVRISFDSQDPELAVHIANAVGHAFIENNLESQLLATDKANGWLNERLSELKQNLNSSEQALVNFLQRQELIDDSGISALTSNEIENLTYRIAEVTERRTKTQALYNALKSSSNADIVTLSANTLISNHPQVRDIRLAESEAEKEVSQLSKRYGPKHDKMIQANARLVSVQRQAEKLVFKLISGFEKELSSAINQELLLKRELLNKKEEFQSLSVIKSEYDALKREVESNAKLYDLFLTRQKETSATSNFSAANARFSDYALLPQLPFKPNRKLIVLFSFAVSFSFAIIVIICLDAFNNTITSARDFENKLGLLPTGILPLVRAKEYKLNHIDASVFSNSKFAAFQESIDSIRTSLYLSMPKTDRKLLALSSSVPGEGKTTTAVSLAQSFASIEKVLLIDCDLRKPSVGTRFGLAKSHPGLTNILVMNASPNDCITSIEGTNLDVLSAGLIVANPQELLSSASFQNLIEKLAEKYDRIIFDTPPILPVKDAFIVGKLTKGIVLILKANSTSKSVYKHTISLFTKHQISIDGVVINQVPQPKKGTHTYSEYSRYAYGNTAS